MKTKFWILLAILSSTLLTTGCFSDNDGLFNCERGEGPLVSEVINIDDFTGIELDIAADIYLTQGSEFSVEVEAQENILNELELDVQGSVLEIDFDDCVRNHDDINFYITMPELRKLSIKGSGQITTENFFTVNDLELKISGSGDIDMGVNADDIEVDISGSGKIFMEGSADKFDTKISGSGDIKSFDLLANKVDVRISGSGDAEVNVVDKLDIKITGSGDVYYRGNPEVNVDISGSGDVVNAN